MSQTLLSEVQTIAERLSPPLTVIQFQQGESFDNAWVSLRDGHVLWRIIRERSVLNVDASPEWDSTTWYDANLLRRLLIPSSISGEKRRDGSLASLSELMATSVTDLFAEIDALRDAVGFAFRRADWEHTKRQLLDLARKRDLELFGRPYKPSQE